MSRLTREARAELVDSAFQALARERQVEVYDPAASRRVDAFEAQLQERYGDEWASQMDEAEEMERELLMHDASNPEYAHGPRTLTLVLGQTGTPTSLVQQEIEAKHRSQGGALMVSGWDMDRFAAGEGFDVEEVDSEALTIELVERAIEAKVNVVVTPSPTTEEMPLALIAAARRSGYQVEVAALAVNPKVSATQAFQRSVAFGTDGQEYSDRHLAHEAGNVGKVLRRIEANGAADRITVFDRLAQPLPRSPSQTASEIFDQARTALTGAEKIRIAAAWEEVAEAFERNGDRLPENAQRMREQAHYALAYPTATWTNFKDRHPEHAATSMELSERYGRTLVKHFDAENRSAVSTYPELTSAFVTKQLLDRVAKDNQLPEAAELGAERIRASLRDGVPIVAPEIKVEAELEAGYQRQTADIER